jgi:hypothetical protein
MSHQTKAALLIFGFVVVGTVLLYLPFAIWFWVKRRRHRTEIRTELRLTKIGWVVNVSLITFLFGGFAAEKLAPESPLGAFINSVSHLGYAGLILLLEVILEHALRFAGYPTTFRKVVLPRPAT